MDCKYLIKYFSIIILLTIFYSCANKEYENILNNVEKIKIIIYMVLDGNIDEENYYIELLNTHEIKKFVKYLKNVSLPITSCGYTTGRILFFDMNDKILINARFNIECKELEFNYNGNNYQMRITYNGIKYLKNIILKMESLL